MNPNTKAVISTVVVGVGYYGARQLGLVTEEQERKLRRLKSSFKNSREDAKEVAAALLRTSVCATAAGWFQVYSGGIVIDTVATRLQAGASENFAIWGLRTSAPVADVVARHVRMSAQKYAAVGAPELAATPRAVYAGLILRSNLMAGHFVTMLSRFPYLFLNFTTYQQTERIVVWARPEREALDAAPKSIKEELLCVSASTLVSTTAITVAECPKIIDQVGGKCGERSTVSSVYKAYGARRLMQGYTACFCREYLFNTALLLSPSLARAIRERVVESAGDGENRSFLADAVDGREIVLASLALGMPMGLLTNAPDQLKTNIQTGQFKNMREAWAAQTAAHGGHLAGLRGLYGTPALYRGIFITHAVVAFNFARDKVERWMDARMDA